MMKVWGRVFNTDGTAYVWTPIYTDSTGQNDDVYLTALCQIIQLVQGESPFYKSAGIPSMDAVHSQVAPDVAVSAIQRQYSRYFVNLSIVRSTQIINLHPTPVYGLTAITHDGSILTARVAQ